MKPLRVCVLLSLLVVALVFSYYLGQPSYWDSVIQAQDAAAQVSVSSSAHQIVGSSGRTGTYVWPITTPVLSCCKNSSFRECCACACNQTHQLHFISLLRTRVSFNLGSLPDHFFPGLLSFHSSCKQAS
jgi:hypothetical protein